MSLNSKLDPMSEDTAANLAIDLWLMRKQIEDINKPVNALLAEKLAESMRCKTEDILIPLNLVNEMGYLAMPELRQLSRNGIAVIGALNRSFGLDIDAIINKKVNYDMLITALLSEYQLLTDNKLL